MKSLFIAGVPKTGSSTLQAILSRSLRLINAGEPLNRERNPMLQEGFFANRRLLFSMAEDHVVKDVVQTQFIIQNIKWLLKHFNVIILVRNEVDVIKAHCLREKNWSGISVALRALKDIANQYSVPTVHFEDFMWDSSNLLDIVEQMYSIRMADYQTDSFKEQARKRAENSVLNKVEIKSRDRWKEIKSIEDAKKYMKILAPNSSEIPKRIAPYVNNGEVLDFGCGLGRFLHDFRTNKIASDWNLTGFDLPNVIELCEDPRTLQLGKITLTSSWKEIKNRKFDVIFAGLVLQHLPLNLLYKRMGEFARMSQYLYVISRDWNDWGIGENMEEIIGKTKWNAVEEYATWGVGLTSHFERLYTHEPESLSLNILSNQDDTIVRSKKSPDIISSSLGFDHRDHRRSLFYHLEERRKAYDPSASDLSDWLLNRKLAIEERNERKVHLNSYPLYLDIELNSMCNLECKFCPCIPGHVRKASSPEAKLTTEEIDKISPLFKYAEVMETSKAAEPFLTPDLFSYVLKKIRMMNPFVVIQTVTNGTALSPAIARDLIENKLDHIYISINGETREKYHEIMGRDKFDRVLSNIEMLQEMKKSSDSKEPYIHFNTQFCKQCEPFAMIDMAYRVGAVEVNFIKTQIGAANYHFAGYPVQDYMEPAEIDELKKNIVDKANKRRVSVTFPGWEKHEFRVMGSPHLFYYPHMTKYFDLNLTCPTDAPWFRFCTSMRNVGPCCWSGVFDRWMDKPFEEIWNGEYLKNMRQKLASGIYPGVCHCRY